MNDRIEKFKRLGIKSIQVISEATFNPKVCVLFLDKTMDFIEIINKNEVEKDIDFYLNKLNKKLRKDKIAKILSLN